MSDIYIPAGCETLEHASEPQKRIGLQGKPGAGKTWLALKFKNPIVLNIDRGLVAHQGRKDVVEVPFYNPSFVDKIIPRSGLLAAPNRRDAILKWLALEGPKIPAGNTLILDSQTQLQNAFHAEYRLNPQISKNGKINEFEEWTQKVIYFSEIMEWLKALKCDVVYICHETLDRDEKGDLNGMIRPLITGQFADQLASHFTDWFRMHTIAKPDDDKKDAFKLKWKLTDAQLKEWISSTDTETIYVLQTQSDEYARHIKTSLVKAPKFILAKPEVFEQYKRVAI